MEKAFEIFSQSFDVDYYFFSAGQEWYWAREHGVRGGNFTYEYLWGFSLGQVRITPLLPIKLLAKDYRVYIKCINGRFALPVTYLIARLKRKPFILWTGIWMRLDTPLHRLFFFLTRWFYRHADALVVYGKHVKDYLITEGVNPAKIFIAPRAVENSFYNVSISESEKQTLRKNLSITSHQKVVLYLGRLEENKGLDYLIEAFASLQYRDCILILAGSGSQESFLKKRIAEKNLMSQVRMPGYIPQQQTLFYYAIAWVTVLPSITTPYSKELWGLVINEAFNQGLPAIATEAVGAAEGGLIEEGKNGFIVPERDSNALAKALDTILGDNRLRQKMSEDARNTIQHWTQEKMMQGFHEAVHYVEKKHHK